MGIWARLADRCIPASALRWQYLDGYRPPAPPGYRWVRGGAHLRVVEQREPGGSGPWPTGGWELRRSPRPRPHT